MFSTHTSFLREAGYPARKQCCSLLLSIGNWLEHENVGAVIFRTLELPVLRLLWHRGWGVISWWSGFTYYGVNKSYHEHCNVYHKHCKADVFTNVARIFHSYLYKIAVKYIPEVKRWAQNEQRWKGAGLHKVKKWDWKKDWHKTKKNVFSEAEWYEMLMFFFEIMCID